MRIKEKLQELRYFYENTRLVGHTKALRYGAASQENIVVIVSNSGQYDKMRQQLPNARVITTSGVQSLRDQKVPLAIDNDAMWLLIDESIREIERLEKINKSLREINRLESEVRKLENA